ncbi:MAG: AraC family transcriptional regulator [Actinomycetota bacterium]|nr:AraC family transcriptional regulator [Actinomycetota bacterium]
MHDALGVIERDLGHDISLDDVARSIATSRRSLQRAFEGEGITFREAVAVARMRRAKVLLAGGQMPVYRVADRVGYRSKAEFTKAFKRYSGMTPTEFVRSHDLDARRAASDAEAREPLGSSRAA